MYDGRTALAKKIQRELRDKFGDHIVKSVIPRSIRMAEAPSKGIPGIVFSPTNKASLEYQRLAKDMLESSLAGTVLTDRKSTRLNSSHTVISYAVFCLKKKNKTNKLT